MQRLPYELYPFIFKHLHLQDLVRLRSVSKFFKFLIDTHRPVKDLYVVGEPSTAYVFYCIGDFQMRNRWFYNEKAANYSIKLNLFDLNDLSTFKKKLIYSNLFFNLKHLKLKYSIGSKNLNLLSHYIAKFIKLEKLEILILSFTHLDVAIRHSNLKILVIDNLRNYFHNQYFPPLALYCPNLETLGCSNIIRHSTSDKLKNIFMIPSVSIFSLRINFTNLESISFIFVDDFNKLLDYVVKLDKLKNIGFESFKMPIEKVKNFHQELKKLSKHDLAVYYGDKKIN